jgi:pyruvate dehydrogenase E2 component (dihydrolipoyllysine-residue acetyltransferase)
MATEFKLPELGENIEAGDLVHLLVGPGEKVSEGQSVMELETDKAVIEVPSSVTGTVKDIRVKEGDKVKVGQVVFTVDDGAVVKPEKKQEDKPVQFASDEREARVEVQTAIRQEGKTQKEALPPDHPLPAMQPKPAGTPTQPSASATEFKLPELGENIESGDLVRLLIEPGATVSEGQSVMEIETDKAVIEVPSSVSGKVQDIRVKAGDKVKVGQVVFTVEGGAAAQPQAQPAAQAPKAAPGQGAKPVARPEAPPVQTTPTRPPLEPVSGQHAARLAYQSALAVEGKSEEEAFPPDYQHPLAPVFEMPSQLTKTAGAEYQGPIPAAPNVRRLARELGVDIYQVKGSGPGGRILQDDVKAFAKSMITTLPEKLAEAEAQAPARVPTPTLPDFSKWGNIERVSMRGVRRKTAEHLALAWNTIPHVTQQDKADITQLEKLRKRFSPKAEQAGGKITVTAIALKVCASALKVYPQFNASIDMAKEEVVYKQYINIGVATDTDRGLLVPVIRDVDKKNIIELAVELGNISKKARDKKLTPADMEGGTFTITNLGGIGGTGFSPIVNFPEVAILGMSRSRIEPCWMNDKFEPRLFLPLSLSYDHRLIDGADAARFLRWVAEALEQPFLLTVQG